MYKMRRKQRKRRERMSGLTEFVAAVGGAALAYGFVWILLAVFA